MASIHRNPRSPKGVWYCAYTLADGRRAYRSTGRKNKTEAKIVCDALAQSENEAAGGDLTKDRLKELFDETLKRLGQSPIELHQRQRLVRVLAHIKRELGTRDTISLPANG